MIFLNSTILSNVAEEFVAIVKILLDRNSLVERVLIHPNTQLNDPDQEKKIHLLDAKKQHSSLIRQVSDSNGSTFLSLGNFIFI